MQTAIRHGTQVAVLFLDIDRFKELNDTLGHATGDAVLQLVAKVLREAMRKNDTPARFGGDEFAVILEDLVDGRDATRVAREIAHRLGRPQRALNHEVFVTASIGIALFPRDGSTAEELVRNADTAMYHRKESGRDGYAFFCAKLDAAARRDLELEGELRDAVARGQLTCHFQPQVDVERGCIIGVEALARWHHARLGWIGPDEFVAIAERRGLIVPMGAHVIELACAAARSWPPLDGRPLRVAVNVTARQVVHGDFVGSVQRALEQHQLEPERLELEITESSLMEERGGGIEALAELRERGVRVAIDDFGTGYSCLGALKRLPVDAIKIDQSFVRGLFDESADAAIVNSIIELAKQLDLETIAEGVETQAQSDFLQSHGCRFMQGYLFGRPVPAEAFLREISKERGRAKLNVPAPRALRRCS